ncbi:MAG: glycosyltransferase [Armatimonadetes bacterium]|nr:glycosyltransferase [Armatimonadota bacterium]
MLKDRNILILGSSSWDASMQRMQHFAHGLAEQNRVVFLDPFNPGPYVFWKVLVRRPLGRPIGYSVDEVRQVHERLSVYYHRTRVLPTREGLLPEHVRRSVEERCLMQRVGCHLRGIRFSPDVVCCTHPQHLAAARRMRGASLIYYDVHDNMPAFFREPERGRLQKLDRALVRLADLVITSSHPLTQRCLAFGRPAEGVHCQPNGVRFDLFSRPAAPEVRERVASLLPGRGANTLVRPYIGYVGTIAWWFDFERLLRAADAHPEWSFVLVGPVVEMRQGDWNARDAPRRPNIHYLGERPYEEVPELIRHFDACLIPFRLNELTESVNPVKMYEYFALGKPVVSTPLPEVAAHGDLCYLASDGPDGLERAIGAALAEGEDAARAAPVRDARVELARHNSWQARIEGVAQLIEAALAARAGADRREREHAV